MEHIPPSSRPQLEVRDLTLAQALASAGSTARAAELMHLSQPAISRALRGTEDRLGVALFERTPQGLTPTAAGERLLAGARNVLAALCDLEQRVRSPSLPVRLRVVCECYTAYHWLPSVVAALRSSAPGLEVTIDVAHAGAPVAALEAGKVDIALLTSARCDDKQVIERPLFSDEVVFVMAKDHPLAAQKTISRAQLSQHTLLTSSNTPPPEQAWFMRTVFGRKKPRLHFERLPLTEAILDVARAGMGVAVLSEWMAGPHLGKGDLVVRRLDTGELRRPWRFAYRADLDEHALRLLGILRTAAPRIRAQRSQPL